MASNHYFIADVKCSFHQTQHVPNAKDLSYWDRFCILIGLKQAQKDTFIVNCIFYTKSASMFAIGDAVLDENGTHHLVLDIDVNTYNIRTFCMLDSDETFTPPTSFIIVASHFFEK